MRNNNCIYVDENRRSSLHQPSELSAVKVCYFKAFIQSELYSVQFSASLYSERINCVLISVEHLIILWMCQNLLVDSYIFCIYVVAV